MNLRKDHSHESNHFHCAQLYVGLASRDLVPSARAPRMAGWAGAAATSLKPTMVTTLSSFQDSNFYKRILMRGKSSQLSATDASVRTTMKGAAKCDKHCKLQNSANQQDLERILRFWDMPGSMPTSEPLRFYVLGPRLSARSGARLCASARHSFWVRLLMRRGHWCCDRTGSKLSSLLHHSCPLLGPEPRNPLASLLAHGMKLGQQTR